MEFKSILFGIYAICFSVTSFGKYNYKIAFQKLPTSINYKELTGLSQYFLTIQLNETLFTLGQNGYISAVLDEWSASNNHKKFRLCPKKISFSNDSEFTADRLKENLELHNSKLSIKTKKIEIINKCVEIEFEESFTAFPAEMDNYEFPMIDVKTSNDKFPMGISPYYAEIINDEQILLKLRNSKEKNIDVDEISIYPLEKIKNISEIDELNFVSQIYDLKKVMNDRVEYLNNVVSGTYLLVNVKDKKIRNAVWNCINNFEFIEKISPSNKFKKLNTIIPQGIPFVEQNEIKQKCVFSKFSTKVKLNLLMGRFENESGRIASQYLTQKLNPLNIEVVVNDMPWADLSKITLSKDKKYDLAMMVITGRLPYYYLASYLIGNDQFRRVSDYEKYDYKKTHLNIIENSKTWKNEIKKLTDKIIEHKYVLPLGSQEFKMYYPKNISLPQQTSSFDLRETKIKDIKIK